MLYASDPNIISIQPLIDLQSNMRSTQVYNTQVALEETKEELKMDLGGYIGDFHRHRTDGEEIKKRTPLTEAEMVDMIYADDRFREIALNFREIDPDRNGFVTQQELDDIFREHYSK